MTIVFDDATWAPYLPATQKYGIYYVDGKYANEAAVKARLPHASLMSLTVFGALSADGCDCEPGNMTPAEAVTWVGHKVAAGDGLIVVYADEDTWKNQGLEKALAHYGDRIKRWIASYDGVAVVPAGFDAKQWASNLQVDSNVALDSFFTPWKPAPVEGNSGIAIAQIAVDLTDGVWQDVLPLPGENVVFAGPSLTWNAQVSLRVGDGGGAWLTVVPLPASTAKE